MSEQNKYIPNSYSVPIAWIDDLREFHLWLKDASERGVSGLDKSTLEVIEQQFQSDVMDILDYFILPQANVTGEDSTDLVEPRGRGYVYLLQSPTGAYKIGRTVNPKDRLKTFSVKLPFEVEYIAVIPTMDMYQLELDLHDRFISKHVNGEWFMLTAEDVDYIKGLAE